MTDKKTMSISISIETEDADSLLRDMMGVDEKGNIKTEVEIPGAGGATLKLVSREKEARV